MRFPPPRRPRERGAALMVILTIILMAGASMAIEALLIKSKRNREDQKAGFALMEAKRTLIAYARTTGVNRLPCPNLTPTVDYGSSAEADSSCANGTTSLGFLPWTTLGLPPLVDGTNSPIWYAVVPATAYASCSLQINGQGSFAAILFAPGDPLVTQNRALTTSMTVVQQQYLESLPDLTLAHPHNFLAPVAGSGTANDRLSGITCQEMLAAIN
ncbi:MAG: hypothetical protein HQM00_13750 [Magnetococcales bacterium]|nr:hypothetical protein [Magnetococcales bacterium]